MQVSVGKLGITVDAISYGTDGWSDTLLLHCNLSDTIKRRFLHLEQKQRRAKCLMPGAENGIILLQSILLLGGEYDCRGRSDTQQEP